MANRRTPDAQVPRHLRLVETHPGGGQYDCLTLYQRSDHSKGDLHLNRDGSATVFHRFDGTNAEGGMMQWRTIWPEAVAAQSLRPVVEELARITGLRDAAKLPASSPEVLSFRVVSKILTAGAFSSDRWACRMGYTDTSGHALGDLVRIEFFEPFPKLQARLRDRREGDFLDQPAYRFWFVLKDGKPELGFEAPSGIAENARGDTFDLMAMYQRTGHRLWPVVWELAGDLLA